MKYCPNCKRDFEDNVETCRWCEMELVNELTDEKAAIAEKLRRELLPTEEELSEEQTDFFAENTDTVTIYTSFDPLQIRDIEMALQEAGIPVLVRPTPVEELDGETEEEAAEEAADEESAAEELSQEEVAEEAVEGSEKEADGEQPEKKGFFARLFGKKKTQEENQEKNDPIVGYRRPNTFAKMAKMTAFHRSDLLDIVVPAALENEAVAAMNGVLGIYAETEITSYSDEELAEFDRETLGTAEETAEDEAADTAEETAEE